MRPLLVAALLSCVAAGPAAPQDVPTLLTLEDALRIARQRNPAHLRVRNDADVTAVAERAEIDLSYTRVIAPEGGLIGKTEVYVGTLVGRGQSTLLTHISRIDPIHVRFTFSEKDYLDLARRYQGQGTAEANPEATFTLLLADGSEHARVLGTPSEWCDLSGTVDGLEAGMLLMPGEPTPWYGSTRADTYGDEGWSNFLNAAFLWDGPMEVAAGQPLTWRDVAFDASVPAVKLRREMESAAPSGSDKSRYGQPRQAAG